MLIMTRHGSLRDVPSSNNSNRSNKKMLVMTRHGSLRDVPGTGDSLVYDSYNDNSSDNSIGSKDNDNDNDNNTQTFTRPLLPSTPMGVRIHTHTYIYGRRRGSAGRRLVVCVCV